MTVAGSGFGTQSDVTVNYFDKVQGLKFVSVPFDDPGLRWNSLLGGHTDLLYAQFGDLDVYSGQQAAASHPWRSRKTVSPTTPQFRP